MDRQIWGERAWESARAGGESSSLHHVGLRTSSINYLCMYACKVNLNRINVKCKIFKGQTPSFPVTIAQATTGRSSWSFQWIGFDAIFRSAHSAPPIRSKLAAAKLCCLSCFSFSGDQADDAAVNHGLVTLPACKARISRVVRHVYSQHRKKKQIPTATTWETASWANTSAWYPSLMVVAWCKITTCMLSVHLLRSPQEPSYESLTIQRWHCINSKKVCCEFTKHPSLWQWTIDNKGNPLLITRQHMSTPKLTGRFPHSKAVFHFFPHRTQQLFWIGCAALTFCPWSSWSLR